MQRLASRDVAALDPYKFMALIGTPLMLERASYNVRAADVAGRVSVEEGDILALPFADDSFDVVIAEAVTMFVDRGRAASELSRVCKPGGLVLATEFLWREPPSAEARAVYLGQVCPGLEFDTLADWIRIYSSAGLDALERPAHLRKMAWLMPKMAKAVPYLGYVLVSGTKPAKVA